MKKINRGKKSFWRGKLGVLAIFTLMMAIALGITTRSWAQTFAYVANYNSDNVSVIDISTNTVIGTVAVGDLPAGVAVTPDGAFAYVTNFVGNSVSVIDTATNTVIATVPVGVGPNRPAITPDGTRVYVPNGTSDNVSVIDISTNTVIATIPMVNDPRNVAITPDGRRAYMTNTGTGGGATDTGIVSVVDTDPESPSYNTVIASIGVGRLPSGIAITPNGAFAYVGVFVGSYPTPARVDMIDINQNKVIGSVEVPNGYIALAITPDGTRVYVVSNSSSSVSVINTADNTVSDYISNIGQGEIAITPDGTRAYVTDGFHGVKVIDINPASSNFHKVITTIGLGYFVGPRGIAITPAPLNTPPVANDQSVTMNKNTAKAITLTATDVDGDTLTYSIVSGPSHGALSGTAPNVTYTPTSGYSGSDSFTFKANDGTVDSNTATVSITVVNTSPVANDQSVTTNKNTPKPITLTATDPEGDPLTYSIVTGPSNGTLSGTTPNVTYTPASDYTGSDSFTFKANDGNADSNTATVSITVNALPVANNQSVTTNKNIAITITLIATDADGDPLTYSITTGPSHGTLGTLTGAVVTYTPASNYTGADSFTFKANDGNADSNTATVSITVTATVCTPPTIIAHPQSQAIQSGQTAALSVTASGTAPLNYQWYRGVSGDTSSPVGTNASSYTTPALTQATSYWVRVSNSCGSVDSNTATITINVQLPGDCNGDGRTTIDEVQKAINQFLGIASVVPCCDLNGNGQVSIDEVQKVINAFLGI